MEAVFLRFRDHEEAASKINEALSRREWIVVAGSCYMEYEGRAASSSTPGDVLVIIKPDGSVLVHGARGYKPLNWQPDTSHISASTREGELIVTAIRRSPREVLLVRCASVEGALFISNPVEGAFWLYLNEAEIRDAIAEDPELIGEELRIVDVEKPVDPGFVDLYAVDSQGRLVVIEVKRVKAGEQAVRQLLRYMEHFKPKLAHVRGILVAPDITDNARTLLERSGLEYRRVDLKRLYSLIREKSKRRRGGQSLLDYLTR